MDETRFDDLTKRLATSRSRRATLKGLGKTMLLGLGLGGPIASFAWSDGGDARTCSAGGAICQGDANCCSGDCHDPDRFGRRRCACENGQTACGTQCCAAPNICLNNVCRTPIPTPTPNLAAGTCTVGIDSCSDQGAVFCNGSDTCQCDTDTDGITRCGWGVALPGPGGQCGGCANTAECEDLYPDRAGVYCVRTIGSTSCCHGEARGFCTIPCPTSG